MKTEESRQDNYTFNPEELKARFNPEGSMLRKQQNRMTEMLLVVDGICKKHGIRYWLCAGTLLGAVRHGGYIPWDDDLDVGLLRKDYQRLMEVLPGELPPTMALQTNDTDKNYFYFFAKLRDRNSLLAEECPYDEVFKERGVFIDIFPFEHMRLWGVLVSNLMLSHIFLNRINAGE